MNSFSSSGHSPIRPTLFLQNPIMVLKIPFGGQRPYREWTRVMIGGCFHYAWGLEGSFSFTSPLFFFSTLAYSPKPITNAQNQLMESISHIPLRGLMCWYEISFKALEPRRFNNIPRHLFFFLDHVQVSLNLPQCAKAHNGIHIQPWCQTLPRATFYCGCMCCSWRLRLRSYV